MTLNDIPNLRLAHQQIFDNKTKTVKDLVAWMGAMQAQDYNMAKWGIGTRIPGSTEKIVESAIDKGEIIRTHVLRPTWHFISADDIHWMLDLTAPRIKASLKSRHKELELTEAIFTKSRRLLEQCLSGNNHLTREELMAEFKKVKINVDDNRGSHILFWSELNGVICSGATKGKKHTYALLEEWVPRTTSISREEALGKLALKYFSSHGPATVQDFTWWSGLTLTAARQALEMVNHHFVAENLGAQTYWRSNSTVVSEAGRGAVFLLPAFDEYIVSYKDRSAVLTIADHKKAVSNNGIFRPTIVIDGIVTGLWKRTVHKEKVLIETTLFRSHTKTEKILIEQKGDTFGRFLGKKAEVIHNFA